VRPPPAGQNLSPERRGTAKAMAIQDCMAGRAGEGACQLSHASLGKSVPSACLAFWRSAAGRRRRPLHRAGWAAGLSYRQRIPKGMLTQDGVEMLATPVCPRRIKPREKLKLMLKQKPAGVLVRKAVR